MVQFEFRVCWGKVANYEKCVAVPKKLLTFRNNVFRQKTKSKMVAIAVEYATGISMLKRPVDIVDASASAISQPYNLVHKLQIPDSGKF